MPRLYTMVEVRRAKAACKRELRLTAPWTQEKVRRLEQCFVAKLKKG